MEDIHNKNDELAFVVKKYNFVINKYLGTVSIAISFFANSEDYVDEISPIKDNPSLSYENGFKSGIFRTTIYQDFSIGKKLLTDCNICKIKIDDEVITFLKIITPFTRARSYDFIIARNADMEDIIKELHIRSEKANFKSFNFPIIGLDFSSLKRETIDFLLNEEFRKFCESRRIQLKRGIVLEGVPGTGKTLSLRWLKEQALKNKISFTSFKTYKDFLENRNEYFTDEKKIFAFEDFDAVLMERERTEGDAPNTILAQVLNTLEGIDEIKEVVSIFTTNKIDIFDSAFLRPGRIDKVFTYSLPGSDEMRKFFEAYISDVEHKVYEEMIEYLTRKSCNVSYAILKGICDDINIFLFSKRDIEYKDVERIMNEKLKGALKGNTAKGHADFIL